jgi:hypothetical protein
MIQKFSSRVSLFLLVVLISFILGGCMDQNEEYIQGNWHRGDVHFADDWYFDRGNFEHYSSVTLSSPRLQAGRYRVLEVEEGSIIIELYDLQLAFGDERQDIKITFDRDNDAIRIMGKDYYRIP